MPNQTDMLSWADPIPDMPGFQEALKRVSDQFTQQHLAAENSLTEAQFVEAMRQALACGDFLRLCTPGKSSCDGVTYTCSVAQAITYEPFRECARLRARIAELEANLDRRQQDEIESDL